MLLDFHVNATRFYQGTDTWQSHFAPARIALQPRVNSGSDELGWNLCRAAALGRACLSSRSYIASNGMRYCMVSWHRPAPRVAHASSERCKGGKGCPAADVQCRHSTNVSYWGRGRKSRGLKIGQAVNARWRAAHRQFSLWRILWPAFWPQRPTLFGVSC